MQVAFYRGRKRLFNRLTSWWLRGSYSHVEIVLGYDSTGAAICASSSMMDGVALAVYVGKGKIGNWVIRKWTGSQESHCELVVDGLAYSSSIQDKGVRVKYIEWNPAHWKFISIPWASKESILKHYEETKDNKYAFFSLLTSQILNRNIDDGNADFCSGWCAEALNIPNPNIYNPNTLASMVEFLNNFKRE